MTFLIGLLVFLALAGLGFFVVGDTSITGGSMGASEIKGNGVQLSHGRVAFAFPSDANYTPAAAVYENYFFDITAGVISATRDIILPLTAGAKHFVFNRTAQSVRIIGASGTGITIATGKGAEVMCDGTNWIRMTADVTP